MPLPRITNALRLRDAALRPSLFQPVCYLSTTVPRRVAMADGGKAVEDIDLAFDYPSEMQAIYTTPSGVHQTRLDKEMGYPDQRLLYALIGILGCAGLYGAIMSNIYEPAGSRTETRSSYSAEQQDTGVHLPNRKPTDSKM